MSRADPNDLTPMTRGDLFAVKIVKEVVTMAILEMEVPENIRVLIIPGKLAVVSWHLLLEVLR